MRLNDKEVTVYAVDFDGTLIVGNHWPDIDGEINLPIIRYLIDEQYRGNKVILYTNRNGEALENAVALCKSYGLIFDKVNENLPEIIEAYGNDSRKISADYYIDDRAINPNLFDWNRMNMLGLKLGYKQHKKGSENYEQ